MFTFIFREGNMRPQFQYASWQFYGWTGPGKPPRGWIKRRKSYGTSMHAWEFALRIGNRLHAIVVWW